MRLCVAIVVALSAGSAAAAPDAGAPSSPTLPLISSADAARRLARAIAGDIALYNEEAVKTARATGKVSSALRSEIAEGRALFERRVVPAHHAGLYSAAVDEIILRKR